MTIPAWPGGPSGEVPPGWPLAEPTFEALVGQAFQAIWNATPALDAWTRLAARLGTGTADTATGADDPAPSSSPD